MMHSLRPFAAAIIALLSAVAPVRAAGTLPFAMQQQVDQNGRPIQCLLNIYQVGTTATPQNIFFDFGLTQPAPNPLSCDAVTGRLPMFWLADGTVHARLTDAGGTPIIDVPVLQVLGPSSGGGGGGSVDPTTIAATGDVKWRVTNETLTGWVKLNGLAIGSATSGAAGRANADTQNLFVYLWTNCPNTHCPVSSGRGASGLADFTANKTITPPDMRSRAPFGRDNMENGTPAGRLLAGNITSGGGDGVDTPNATGGEANHTLLVTELAVHNHTLTDPGHAHNFSATQTSQSSGSGATFNYVQALNNALVGNNTAIDSTASTGVSIAPAGSGAAHNVLNPVMLGTWYVKL